MLIDPQQDFVSPDGELAVRSGNGCIHRIRDLVLLFREHGIIIWVKSQYEAYQGISKGIDATGDNLMARPPRDSTRSYDPSNDDDEKDSQKLFTTAKIAMDESVEGLEIEDADVKVGVHVEEGLLVTGSAHKKECCIEGKTGADFAAQSQDMMDAKDLLVSKTRCSTFASTSLLFRLRSRLITELFVGGDATNLSVLATAVDAARHRMKSPYSRTALGIATRADTKM